MQTLLQDLRFSLRTLRKSPIFTFVAVCSLALGIGANTAIFTLMDQVLLRMLPIHNPEELVMLDGPGPNMGAVRNSNAFSYPMYVDFRDHNQVFTGVLARFPIDVSVTYNKSTEKVNGELVSGNYFEVLGVKPAIGRTFTQDDDRTPGAHPLAVLSYGYWQRRFGGDPNILNQSISVNGHSLTVIGVSQPGFRGVEVGSYVDVMVPMMMKAAMTPTWDDMKNRRSLWLNAFARLKPGLSREQAAAAMNVLYHQILEQELKEMSGVNERFAKRFLAKKLLVEPGQRGRSGLRRQFTTPLFVLMAMVGLVLLIACANVANLLMARAAARQKEIAIRLALGASRRQIIRQLLVESSLLAFIGGALGLLVASWTGHVLLAYLPFEDAARTFSSSPDPRAMLFTLVVAMVTGIGFGLVPAIQATRPVVAKTLKDEAGNLSGVASTVRLRKALVVSQVALSLLLLIGAGLFARSLYNLKSLNPGFQTENLIAFNLDPSLIGYDGPRTLAFYRQLQERIQNIHGVRAASLAASPVLTDNTFMMTVAVEGYHAKEGEDLNPQLNEVGPNFFATLGLPLINGRDFTERDGIGAPKVAIINETFAKYFFGDQNPIGRRIGVGRAKEFDIEIVGVARDSRALTLREKPQRMMYFPYLQDKDTTGMTIYVRSALAAPDLGSQLRETVQRIDSGLPVTDMKTMERVVDESLFIDRMISLLSAFFGLLATLLAALGLYGVMAFSVARRTREIGIRIALGAARADVIGMVMREVFWMAGTGIVIGLPCALLLSKLIESQLFGLNAMDPLTIGIAVATLTTVALLAGFIPASRATRIDPMGALRYE